MTSWVCAETVVKALIAAGVRQFVGCPGSRNAPLLLHLAGLNAAGDCQLTMRADERGAAFLALGAAKASGQPVAVVTTSGTAVANLLPALAEAHHAGVPVIAVTADRPATLVGVGASQTTFQHSLYAPIIPNTWQVNDSDHNQQAWPAQVQRCVIEACGALTGRPGPAHINIAITQPAPPTEASPPVAPEITPISLPERHQPPQTLLPVLPNTVVVAADADVPTGRAAQAFAESANLPLLAEPSSNARWGPNAIRDYHALLNEFDIARVICFGRPTLSRSIAALLKRAEVISVADHRGWADPTHSMRQIVWRPKMAADDSDWLDQWRAAAARHALSASRQDHPEAKLTPGAVANALIEAWRPGETLFLGSSNVVRDIDRAAVLTNHEQRVCLANRGLAGIDGSISTAWGIALHSTTTAYLGDLTAIHDINGLLQLSNEALPPLRVVVLDDRGGGIFSSLEVAERASQDDFERCFGLPYECDLAGLGRAFGWSSVAVADRETLAARLTKPVTGPELIVVQVARQAR